MTELVLKNPAKKSKTIAYDDVEAATAKSNFTVSDLELLDSGYFADAEVFCGVRTWKVHRFILCSRSAWFKAALDGPFQEGLTRKVKITNFSPGDIQCVLDFAYSSKIDPIERDENGRPSLIEFNNLAILADYFQMEHMGDCVIRLLGVYLGGILNTSCDFRAQTLKKWKDVQKPGWSVERALRRHFKPRATFIVELCEAVRDAYSRPSVTRLVYVDFIYASRVHTFMDENIQKLTKECSEFGHDLACAMMSGPVSTAFQGHAVFDTWKDGVSNPFDLWRSGSAVSEERPGYESLED